MNLICWAASMAMCLGVLLACQVTPKETDTSELHTLALITMLVLLGPCYWVVSL